MPYRVEDLTDELEAALGQLGERLLVSPVADPVDDARDWERDIYVNETLRAMVAWIRGRDQDAAALARAAATREVARMVRYASGEVAPWWSHGAGSWIHLTALTTLGRVAEAHDEFERLLAVPADMKARLYHGHDGEGDRIDHGGEYVLGAGLDNLLAWDHPDARGHLRGILPRILALRDPPHNPSVAATYARARAVVAVDPGGG
jgi:hypothetical protein